MTTISYDSSLVLGAFLEVDPELDTRGQIVLADQASALIRSGSFDVRDLMRLARSYAALGGDPSRFALWAHKRRPRDYIRNWWTRD